MKFNKRGGNPFWTFFIILAIIGAVILFAFATRWMISQWGAMGKIGGEVPLNNAIEIPSSWGSFGSGLETFLNWLFVPDGVVLSWQIFLIQIVVFIILGLVFADIMEQFSTFKEKTAKLVGWMMAVVAALTGMVRFLMVWLGVTAGLGAIGIGLIFVNAILVAVLMNLFIGNRAIASMKSARDIRDIQNKASSTMRAFAGARATAEAINKGNDEGSK